MPKRDSAQTLLKRLAKIERAQGRLGTITTRIRVQADTLAELLKVAQAFAAQSAPPKAPAPKRTTGVAKKATSPRRAARKAAPATRPASTRPGARRAPAAARTATPSSAQRPRRTPSG